MLLAVNQDQPLAYVDSGSGVGVVDTAPVFPATLTVSNDYMRTGFFTISFWFKSLAPTVNKPLAIMCTGTNSNNHMTVLLRPSTTGTNPGRLQLMLAGPLSVNVTSTNRFDDERWHHCAIVFGEVFETTNIELWFDGQFDTNFQQPKYFKAPSNMINSGTTIGQSKWITGATNDGVTLDELAFFNRVLPDERIKAHSKLSQDIEIRLDSNVSILSRIDAKRELIYSLASQVLLSSHIGYVSNKRPLVFSLSSTVSRSAFIDVSIAPKPRRFKATVNNNKTQATIQRKESIRV